MFLMLSKNYFCYLNLVFYMLFIFFKTKKLGIECLPVIYSIEILNYIR